MKKNLIEYAVDKNFNRFLAEYFWYVVTGCILLFVVVIIVLAILNYNLRNDNEELNNKIAQLEKYSQPVTPKQLPVITADTTSVEKPKTEIPDTATKVTAPPVKTESTENIHIVKKGESLALIAKKYNMTLKQLIDTNKIKAPYTVKPGQKLKVK